MDTLPLTGTWDPWALIVFLPTSIRLLLLSRWKPLSPVSAAPDAKLSSGNPSPEMEVVRLQLQLRLLLPLLLVDLIRLTSRPKISSNLCTSSRAASSLK